MVQGRLAAVFPMCGAAFTLLEKNLQRSGFKRKSEMPRHLTFKIGKKEYAAAPAKIDRRKLYGWTELMAADDEGRPCELLTADESGRYIIPLGGTGNGILSPEGCWVERSELKTVDPEGKPAELFRSSYDGVNQLAERVSPKEFLDYSITDFYELTEAAEGMAEAVGKNIFRFEYTYNDSYDPSPAFVMATGGRLFLLVAVRNGFEWLCFGDCETIDEDYADDLAAAGDKDLDFSMF